MVFKDRVAKYPGRWTMKKSDGSSEVVTLVRNDEPTVEGTPMNAETLNTLSDVAGADIARQQAEQFAEQAKADRKQAQDAASTAANDVTALLKGYTDSALASKTAAAASQTAAKASETESAKNLQGTREYYEQVRTITIGAQGWYATPEALKAAVPVGENGWWAVVGTTDTILTWDSDTGEWKDSVQKADLSDYYTRAQTDQKFTDLKAEVDEKLAGIEPYPVGSIYQSTDAASPAALFGGTWEQIASDRVLMGASAAHAAATTAEAGLPNISGTFTAAQHSYYDADPTGAFSRTAERGSYGPNNDSYMRSWDIAFSASKSNAIYGRSTTVQPPAYYVYIWRRVA